MFINVCLAGRSAHGRLRRAGEKVEGCENAGRRAATDSAASKKAGGKAGREVDREAGGQPKGKGIYADGRLVRYSKACCRARIAFGSSRSEMPLVLLHLPEASRNLTSSTTLGISISWPFFVTVFLNTETRHGPTMMIFSGAVL